MIFLNDVVSLIECIKLNTGKLNQNFLTEVLKMEKKQDFWSIHKGITLWLRRDVVAKLEEIARQKEWKVSQVIKKAINEYLQKHNTEVNHGK